MPSFDHTIDLERSLLKILTSSRMECREFIHKVKTEYFTSTERAFIFECIDKVYTTSSSLMSFQVYQYEVNQHLGASQRVNFIGEWNLIAALDVIDTAEVLIERLETADQGRKISQLNTDLDTHLEAGEIEEAITLLKQKAVTLGTNIGAIRPTVELTDYKVREAMLRDKIANPLKYQGLQTGFSKFDNLTGGLFPGELTLITGVTGTGKSTLVRQIQRNIVTMNPGKNVLHIANEEYLEQVEHKFDAVFTEIDYLDFKRGTISEEDLEKWIQYMENWHVGRVFVKEVPAFSDTSLIESAYIELQNKGINIDIITIDHLPHVKPRMKAHDTNDERAKAATDCKELARELKVHVLVPTQGSTVLDEKQKRGQRGGKMDVYGSKHQVHVANTFLIITVQGTDDSQTTREEYARDVFWMCDIQKNRDGPPFWFKVCHRVNCGRIEDIEGSGAAGPPPKEEEDGTTVKQNDAAYSGSGEEKTYMEDTLGEGSQDSVEATPVEEEEVQEPTVVAPPSSTESPASRIAARKRAKKERESQVSGV